MKSVLPMQVYVLHGASYIIHTAINVKFPKMSLSMSTTLTFNDTVLYS